MVHQLGKEAEVKEIGSGRQGLLPCWGRCQIALWHIALSSDKEALRKSHNGL